MKAFISFIIILCSLSLMSCSSCDGENPSLILVNNGIGKADIQIKTSGGNTENINNIAVGTQSEKRSFDDGDIEITISIRGVNDPIVYNLKVSSCRDYILNINADNTATGTSNERD